ncbi:unnamed protein product (mitochondrion) [Plasmodiophora brassicae]|uniref:Uncharacterized protein n=1 Tax=Plasmodiophora brassicae TaxID=37360 RepID=A0A3P3YH13_PLABS|nr:unnamed protein product [Plasmodiophora brassicae]
MYLHHAERHRSFLLSEGFLGHETCSWDCDMSGNYGLGDHRRQNVSRLRRFVRLLRSWVPCFVVLVARFVSHWSCMSSTSGSYPGSSGWHGFSELRL